MTVINGSTVFIVSVAELTWNRILSREIYYFLNFFSTNWRAKIQQQKEAAANAPAKPSEVQVPQQPVTQSAPNDPMAEAWASENPWFGQNRAMTFTAFEIHKDLVDKEGFDPKSKDYYEEIDRRMRIDFPNKFGNTVFLKYVLPFLLKSSLNCFRFLGYNS